MQMVKKLKESRANALKHLICCFFYGKNAEKLTVCACSHSNT